MRIVIYGAGENGVQALVCLRRSGLMEVAGFLDGNPAKTGATHAGLPVYGDLDQIPHLAARENVTGAIVAVGDNYVRARLTAAVRDAGLEIVTAVHPWALIETPRHIGAGCVVEMGAAIHVDADLGDGVFVGGGAIVSHHSAVGDYCLLGGGMVFGGHVQVGPRTVIGVGANVRPHTVIGSDSIVGVGAVVVKDVPSHVAVAGVPARIIRRLDGDGGPERS